MASKKTNALPNRAWTGNGYKIFRACYRFGNGADVTGAVDESERL